MKSVFEFKDYKAYLSAVIESRPNKGRGERSKIAAILRCHMAYVSQVLNGEAQLSLEQADILNQYFSHSPKEADFFLLLVSLARAGSKSLRDHYQSKVEEVLASRELLKNRLVFKKEIPIERQSQYYSAWYYTAIHFLITIPEYQTREAIVDYLNLSPRIVNEVLEFLLEAGLAIQKGNRYYIGQTGIHLGSDSPMISKHHANWRFQALQSIERQVNSDLHYSSIISVGRKDIPKVRAVIVEAIERIRAIVRPSPSEALYCYSMDLFEVGLSQEKNTQKFNIKKTSPRKVTDEKLDISSYS